MDTIIENSAGAAHVARRSTVSARDLVQEVLKTLPNASRDEQFRQFQHMLADEPEYQRSVDWYFFSNVSDYILGTRKSKKRDERSEERRSAIASAQEALKDSIKQSIELLALTMPNGKPMRECTGREMATFGAGFKKVADMVGAMKRVGDVLNEDGVRAILAPRGA